MPSPPPPKPRRPSTGESWIHRSTAGRSPAPREHHHRLVDELDLCGALRRIRRRAALSQRELAEACEISQSAVAQAESGRRDLPVGILNRAAALAGLRLALLDPGDQEVVTMT